MNPSDSSQKTISEDTAKHAIATHSAKDQISQEEIDQYMRMVGRLLYDIILDWVKKRQGNAQGTANPPLDELLSAEGSAI